MDKNFIDKPLISVIMPCYNVERYLNESIESILNQTFKNFELILIDDGSTDRTFEILKEYSLKDCRIKLIQNEENLKLISTLNKGIDIAKGDYIARMDADDISVLNRFEIQLNYLIANPDIDIVSTGYYNITDEGMIISRSIPRQYSSIGCLFASFFYVPIGHPELLVKTKVLKDNKYLFVDYTLHTEDFELWSRLLRKGYRFSNIKECLHYFRINSNSISRKYTEIQNENFVECARLHYLEYTKKSFPTSIVQVLVNRTSKNIKMIDLKKGIKELINFKLYFIKNENIINHINLKEIHDVFYSHLFDICYQAAKKSSIIIKFYALWILICNCKMFFSKNVFIYIRNKRL